MGTQLKNCTFNDEVVKKSNGYAEYAFDAPVSISVSSACGGCLSTNGYVAMNSNSCGSGTLQVNIPIYQSSCGGSNYFGSLTHFDNAEISAMTVCGYYNVYSCGTFYGNPNFYASAYFYSDIYCSGGAAHFCGCGAYFYTPAYFSNGFYVCGGECYIGGSGAYFNTYAYFCGDAYFHGGVHFCGCGVDFNTSCGGITIYSGGIGYYFSGFSGGVPIFTVS